MKINEVCYPLKAYIASVRVVLKNTSKVIDLARGKNSVEVSNGEEMISVLLKLQEALLDGSLDGQVEVAADSVKARFSK